MNKKKLLELLRHEYAPREIPRAEVETAVRMALVALNDSLGTELPEGLAGRLLVPVRPADPWPRRMLFSNTAQAENDFRMALAVLVDRFVSDRWGSDGFEAEEGR